MNMITMLLIGGTGNIGSMLLKVGTRSQYKIVGRSKLLSSLIRIDYNNYESIYRVIRECGCDSIVLLAAISKLDECENNPITSNFINIKLPELVAKACCILGKHLIFLSTDYVYDGSIDSTKDEGTNNILPLSRYAHQKFVAESKVLNTNANSLVLRIPRIYSIHSTNFLTSSLKLLKQTTCLSVASDQVFSPLSAVDLDFVLKKSSELQLTGIFNCGGPDALSRFDYMLSIKKRLSLPCELKACQLTDFTHTLFVPNNSSLNSDRLNNLLDYRPTKFNSYLMYAL